jgi:hypothetical protein
MDATDHQPSDFKIRTSAFPPQAGEKGVFRPLRAGPKKKGEPCDSPFKLFLDQRVRR